MLLSLDLDTYTFLRDLITRVPQFGPLLAGRVRARAGCECLLLFCIEFILDRRSDTNKGVYTLAASCAHCVVIHWTTPFAIWPCPLDTADGHDTIRTEEFWDTDEHEEG